MCIFDNAKVALLILPRFFHLHKDFFSGYKTLTAIFSQQVEVAIPMSSGFHCCCWEVVDQPANPLVICLFVYSCFYDFLVLFSMVALSCI